MAEDIFKQSLPQSYKYSIESFEGTIDSYLAILHVNLNTIQEADIWVRSFERATKTNWNVRKTYPQLEKLRRKDYVCHMQNFHNRPLKGRKSLTRFKFTGCPADLTVKIKPVTKATRLRYKWVRDGMPAKIIICFRHNHAVTSSEILSFRKLDPAVRRMFAGYFALGMSAAAAAKYHRQRIATDPAIGNPAIALEDAARNPRRTTVSYLYALWRESKLEEAVENGTGEETAVVGKSYNEDVIDHDPVESSELSEPARVTTTTSDAWQALATKVDVRIRQLSPHDRGILDAIAVMEQTFDRIKTYKELVDFLHSPSLHLPKNAVCDNRPSTVEPTSVSTLDVPTASLIHQHTVPIGQNGMLTVPISLMSSMDDAAAQQIDASLAVRRKQNRSKRSNNKRNKCSELNGSISLSAASFDPLLSASLNNPCGTMLLVDNSASVANASPVANVATSGVITSGLPCYSACADFQISHASYLPTSNWDYL